MPIKIPDDLPATSVLEAEGVMVMREADAIRQDIRPLKIGLLNLMPNKVTTETQIARLLGATPLQVELTLVRITNHVARNTPSDHMLSFYRPWVEVSDEKFDGFVITGAPVERLPYEEVTYWDEMQRVFEWTQTHVHRTFNICWAAQAAVYHFHGMPKYDLDQKAFGIFRQRNLESSSPYLRGFSDDFALPVSRWTEVRADDIPSGRGLKVLVDSVESGLCLLEDPKRRSLYMFNHVEYDTTSLADEYFRDLQLAPDTPLPVNYFPANDVTRKPENRWRGHAHLLFGNWINEMYQSTPYDMELIGKI